MELIIKLIFVLSMFVFNLNAFRPIYNMKDDSQQIGAFMLLAGFNVVATTIIVLVLHPHMENNIPALAFCGFVGGAMVFGMSIIPFIKREPS